MAKVALLILALVVSGRSQQAEPREALTWGSLRFGMSLEEVKAHLGDRAKVALDTADPSRVNIDIAGVKVGEHEGTGLASFDKDRKLVGVRLDFSVVSKSCFGSGPEPEKIAKKIARINQIGAALVERYGAPTMETPRWPGSKVLVRHFLRQSLEFVKGNRLWKTPNQIVEADLHVMCDSVYLYVSYKPVARAGAPEL
jgi:hypothetical protein